MIHKFTYCLVIHVGLLGGAEWGKLGGREGKGERGGGKRGEKEMGNGEYVKETVA